MEVLYPPEYPFNDSVRVEEVKPLTPNLSLFQCKRLGRYLDTMARGMRGNLMMARLLKLLKKWLIDKNNEFLTAGQRGNKPLFRIE